MKKLSLAAVAFATVLPALVQAQNIAVVNGKTVPKARFEALIGQIVKQGQPRTPDLERQVKDELVLREIFQQEAKRQHLDATNDYKIKTEIQNQNILINEMFSQFSKDHPVTDAEVKAEYDKLKAQAGGKEYRARHILVEKEEEAQSIITQLKGGADFAELAKKLSKDPGSAPNGGDLDWAPSGNYVPEFGQAITQLEKGKSTDKPIKTQFGWHVIRLDDVRDVQFPPLDEVKAQLQQRLQQQKLAKFRDELKTKARTDYTFTTEKVGS
ncbi:MAG: peptidylprolyl isomerase [Leptothrix ochracea]|uniref:peptidylprolyl isomerase n=1 Tax=Leptothrix ochracea TaxID=735331 RepID=UPI0034E1C566